MQGEIGMDLPFCQSENGFSLDELIVKSADASAWEDYRQTRMDHIGNVVFGVENYKCVSQNLR